jgi:hypothetical protein
MKAVASPSRVQPFSQALHSLVDCYSWFVSQVAPRRRDIEPVRG